MESMTGWACALIVCALMASLTDWLTQDTSLSRTVRFVLGGFLLCALVFPMGSAVREAGAALSSFSEVPREPELPDMTKLEKEVLKEKLSEGVREALSQEGIYPESVEVELTVTDTGDITRLKAAVVLPEDAALSCLRAETLLRDHLGMEAEVTHT